jgi:hypothetical protein
MALALIALHMVASRVWAVEFVKVGFMVLWLCFMVTLPCFAFDCLALPCLALSLVALYLLAFECLASGCLALSCLACCYPALQCL